MKLCNNDPELHDILQDITRVAGDSMGLKEAFAKHEVMCVRPTSI